MTKLKSLPTKLIKDDLDDILPVIAKIVNVSLKNRSFFDAWKTATIRPGLSTKELEACEQYKLHFKGGLQSHVTTVQCSL